MEVTLEEKGQFDRNLTIRIPAERVNILLDQEIKRISETVTMPGFRRGKIPRKLLESRYGDHLRSGVTQQLHEETFVKALQEHSLQPIEVPTLDLGIFARDQDYVYSASFQIWPTIEAKGYVGMELIRPQVVFTESDVDSAVEEMRKNYMNFAVQAEAKAAPGDRIVMAFEGKVDGVPFPGGKASGFVLDLGKNTLIPGFEEQLEGVAAGEEREVRVTFPENYHARELAGKEAVFHCQVSEVQTGTLPQVDDELAKRAGVTEGGMARLREDIRGRFISDGEKYAQKEIKSQILDKLLASNSMELPTQLVERELMGMVQHAQGELQRQGMSEAQIGSSQEMLRAQFQETAVERVKLGLLIASIFKQENLVVGEPEIEAQLDEMVAPYAGQKEKMKAWLRTRKDQMDYVDGLIQEKKVLQLIIEKGVVAVEERSLLDISSGE
ncbi:MAG: trigger factor [Magnetococcus sp. DMHC-6]